MPLRKKIRSGHIIIFLLLMVTYFFIFLSTWNLQKEYDRVANGYKAQNKIAELRNSIVEAETSVRGFYITKDVSLLKPHKEIETRIPAIYNELKTLEKNPQQLALADSVKQLIDMRLTLMKTNIGLFEAAGR